METEDFLTIMVVVCGGIASYFTLHHKLERDMTETNHKQDKQISSLQSQLKYERELTNQQIVDTKKRLRNQILNLQDRVTELTNFVQSTAKNLGTQQWIERETKLGQKVTQEFYSDDDPVSSDLNDTTFH